MTELTVVQKCIRRIIESHMNSTTELDEWSAEDMIANAGKSPTKLARPSKITTVGNVTTHKGTYGSADDDEEQVAPTRSAVATSISRGSHTVLVTGDHNIKVGHTMRGVGVPPKTKVTNVEGNVVTISNPAEVDTVGEHLFGPGAGRQVGSKSGAHTHGSDGGIANKSIYGGHDYKMPQFSSPKFSK